nr:hypothetical protein [Tanacetum cinerariifolium]
AENKHLKQTSKQLYDLIKPTRVRSKEQCDALTNQFNQKSVEISDLNANLQEQETPKVDVEPLAPILLNNRTVHSDYLRLTQEQAVILQKAVEQGTAPMHHSKLNANSELICVKCNGCMISDKHDLCVLNVINDVHARAKSKSVKKISMRKVLKPTGKVFTKIRYNWRPTGRTFTIVGNDCPLTRITTNTVVPSRKPIALEIDTPKPIVTLVYSRKP